MLIFDAMQMPLIREGGKIATRRPVKPQHYAQVYGARLHPEALRLGATVDAVLYPFPPAADGFRREWWVGGVSRAKQLRIGRTRPQGPPGKDVVLITQILIETAAEMSDKRALALGACWLRSKGAYGYPTHRQWYLGATPTEAYLEAWNRWWRTDPDALVWRISFDYVGTRSRS